MRGLLALGGMGMPSGFETFIEGVPFTGLGKIESGAEEGGARERLG